MESAFFYLKIPGVTGGTSSGGDALYFEALTPVIGSVYEHGTSTAQGTPASQSDEIPETLWQAQDSVIAQQSVYIERVIALIKKKQEKLPDEESSLEVFLQTVLDELIEKVSRYSLVKLLMAISGVGSLASSVLGFLVTVGLMAVKDLAMKYAQAEPVCSALITENTALLALEQGKEHYLLRSRILQQHDATLHNMLTEIAQVERIASQGAVETTGEHMDELIEAVKMIAYTENIVQCPYSGQHLYTKTFCLDAPE